MPASLFNPSSSVLLHSVVGIDEDTLLTLQPEEYLLVHSAPCATSNDYLEETDLNGDLVYAAWFNFKIRWSVSATALALQGLANYHPGARLSTQSLQFLNAARAPFLIPAPADGARRLVYENPRQDPIAGDLVAVTFDIVSMFGPSTGPALSAGDIALDSSLTPAFEGRPDYADLYGIAFAWLRYLDITSPLTTAVVHYTNLPYWQTTPPTAGTSGLTLAQFLAAFDPLPNVAGKEIIEIFSTDVPGGRYLYPAASTTGLALTAYQSGAPYPIPTLPWTYLLECSDPLSDAPSVANITVPVLTTTTYATAAAFQAAGHVPSGLVMESLYSLAHLAWIYPSP